MTYIEEIHAIQDKMSALLSKGAGCEARLTHRGDREWTITGTPEAAKQAVRFVVDSGFMINDGGSFYGADDPDYMYFYMREAGR